MINKLKHVFCILDKKTQIIVIGLVSVRSFLGIFDLIGIILMGLLLAKSSNLLTKEGSNSNFISSINLDFISDFTVFDLTVLVLVVFVLKSVLSSFSMKAMAKTLAKAESNLAVFSFKKVLNSNISFISKRSKSDLVYSLTYSPGFAITNLITVATIIFVESLLLVLIILVFSIFNWKITLFITIYFLIIGILIQTVVGKKFRNAGKMYAESSVQSGQNVEDALAAFREIKSLDKQDFFAEKFQNSRAKMAYSTSMIGYLSALPRFIVESALMIGAVLLVVISFSQSDSSSAAQTLGIFLTGGLRIMASMLPLQNSLGTTRQLLAQAEKFLELEQDLRDLLEVNVEAKGSNTLHYSGKPVSVALENVSFRYKNNEEDVLTNLSIEIKAGSNVAFIGPSGAGKSTLVDLISGVALPTSGNLHYEIETQKVENVKDLRFGYVPQKPGIISGTLLENIAFGTSNTDMKQGDLDRAINIANLKDLIDELPGGLNYHLGANSDALSGGQLQRIGLARAIYSNPNLLILDEATSALDVDSEAAVTSSLMKLKGFCTTIVIAHRLTTVQNADLVYVIESGKIVASGSFSELAKSNDLVARYVELSDLGTSRDL